jgi:phthalate 4,5-dioxygenase oxygenase subunit
MLTSEENRRLAEVGPGTPMGELFRHYWLPFALSEELVAGGAPLAVTLLGEALVAWRAPDGTLGLMERYCPHRGVSLAYGRNEPEGLRCIYHGWKINARGQVLETPNARTSERFRQSIRPRAYALYEAEGLIFAYLGLPEKMPPFPDWAWRSVAASERAIVKIRVDANWLQVLEGGVDTSHLDFLHSSEVQLHAATTDPELRIEDTSYGFRYAGIRSGTTPDQRSVRVTQFLWPSQVFVSIGPPGSELALHHYVVPIDDRECWVFDIRFAPPGAQVSDSLKRYRLDYDRFMAELELDQDFRPRRRRENGHLQDREWMAQGHWCGIAGIRSQDLAVVESADTIIDRSREHLVAADAAITHLRQRFFQALKGLERGEAAPGLLPSAAYRDILPAFRVIPEEAVQAGAYWSS